MQRQLRYNTQPLLQASTFQDSDAAIYSSKRVIDAEAIDLFRGLHTHTKSERIADKDRFRVPESLIKSLRKTQLILMDSFLVKKSSEKESSS